MGGCSKSGTLVSGLVVGSAVRGEERRRKGEGATEVFSSLGDAPAGSTSKPATGSLPETPKGV